MQQIEMRTLGGYNTLRARRLRAGYTQKELANCLGYASRNAYSMKERGERRFSVEEAMIVAQHLKISVEELFYQE